MFPVRHQGRYNLAMIKKGRIFLDGIPITPMMEFDIQRDDALGTPHWRGSCRTPAGFRLAILPSGVGTLELDDGQRTNIYFLSHDPKTHDAAFHLPSAELRE